MPKYAEWDDVQYGGRNNRIIKGYKKQSRRIYDENDRCYLIHDQEGPVWIPKQNVTVVEKDEDTQI